MPTVARTCDFCGATGQRGAFCEECGQTLPDTPTPAPEPVTAPEPAIAPEPAVAPEPVSAPGAGSPPTRVVPAQPSVPPGSFPPAGEGPAPAGGKAWTWDMLFNSADGGGGSAFTPAAPVPPPAGPRLPPSAPDLTAADNPSAPDPTVSDPGAPDPAASDMSATRPIASDANERGRALFVPVNDPTAAAPKGKTGAPVLPGRPEPVMPTAVRAPETEADTVVGGRACPWCATANPVDRHFCRRCAMSLDVAQASAPVYRPWWRRLFGWSGNEMPYAGERPRLRRDPGRLWRWLAGLAVVGAVIGAVAAWGGDAVAAVEDHFASATITYANTVTASSSDRAHPVAKIHDGYNNTWWGVAGEGVGTHVDATFAQPTNLLDVVITPGAGITQNAFTSELSPQTIDVTTTSANGGTSSSTLSLPDSPGARTFPVRGNDITKVSFTIESSYQGTASKPEVAITEIEFFEKS